MNKNLLIFMGIFMLFLSCKDDKTDEIFEVYPASLSLTGLENSSFFEIISNCNWSLSTGDEWLTCSPTFGKGERSIIVTASENPTPNPRSCTVTVTSEGGAAYSVQVTQDGREPFINITPEYKEVLLNGGDVSIQVSALGEWTVQIPANAADWISLKTKTETQAVLAVATNESGGERSADIIFKLTGYDKQATFNLKQVKSVKKEVEVDRSLFSLAEFPGDYSESNNPSQGYTVEKIWTEPAGIRDVPTYISLVNGHVLPQWFTIDLGATCELSKMKYFQRGSTYTTGAAVRLYAGGNLREFEIWAALDPDFDYNPDDHGGDFGQDWILLKSCSVNRPSGNTLAPATSGRSDNTAEDIAVAAAGHEFSFNHTGKVRYLRIKTISNWDGSGSTRDFVNIASIVLWAME